MTLPLIVGSVPTQFSIALFILLWYKNRAVNICVYMCSWLTNIVEFALFNCLTYCIIIRDNTSHQETIKGSTINMLVTCELHAKDNVVLRLHSEPETTVSGTEGKTTKRVDDTKSTSILKIHFLFLVYSSKKQCSFIKILNEMLTANVPDDEAKAREKMSVPWRRVTVCPKSLPASAGELYSPLLYRILIARHL